MNFDSHTSDVVAAAVRAINLLTPGHTRGREYTATGYDDYADRSPEEVEELRAYAMGLRSVFAAVDDGRVDDACTTVNTILRDFQAAPFLTRHDGEPWHLHFHAPDASWARSHIASMATGLAVVLGNPMHDRLGVCTAPACDRVFVDVTRNGTKRFCSTACQNRVKTAAFRARHRD
ncbi:CGNR zinc finger domain-containing protein [Actinocrispum wychmicini]|uniref:Putative stress-induced transcription regulator n=1 Tax=Actinocrispum wychmicini TaxID=1213861 RepID=A0A4R2JFW1_9PSEU|nr:CGNR zinc finger domain-containing protein [Actinocrispum wychmicini]TCO53155.1 putative stress-induced transcription regulator [Actinocrispum wychmicini]